MYKRQFLGIVQAGGFYVLINPELPRRRMEQIQSVLQAEYLITDAEHQSQAGELVAHENILNVDQLVLTQVNEAKLAALRDVYKRQMQSISPSLELRHI